MRHKHTLAQQNYKLSLFIPSIKGSLGEGRKEKKEEGSHDFFKSGKNKTTYNPQREFTFFL